MWKVQVAYRDEAGIHRWRAAGPERFATRKDAQRGAQAACEAFLENPRGFWSARFRVALAAAAACAVLQ